MSKAITILQVLDFGKFHKEIIQLSLTRVYGDEDQVDEAIYIKYGNRREPHICSTYYFSKDPDTIFLSAAGTGSYGDIKITIEEWLKALERMGSKLKLEYWNNIINKVHA